MKTSECNTGGLDPRAGNSQPGRHISNPSLRVKMLGVRNYVKNVGDTKFKAGSKAGVDKQEGGIAEVALLETN